MARDPCVLLYAQARTFVHPNRWSASTARDARGLASLGRGIVELGELRAFGAVTDFILEEKGEEVISERHQRDFKKEGDEMEDQEKKDAPSAAAFTDISFEDI